MKRSFLLLCTCLVSLLSYAQGPFKAGAHNHTVSAPVVTSQPLVGSLAPHSGAKTTTALSRWYNFADFMLWPYQDYMGKGTYWSFYPMWNDTLAIIGYADSGATYRQAGTLSMGLGFDPTYLSTAIWDYGWNICNGIIVDFRGFMEITSIDAYTIDSVFVAGIYARNNNTPAKAAVVDTLIVSFVKGSRTSTTSDLPPAVLSAPPVPYGMSAINYHDLFRDTVNNRAAHNGGGTLSGTTEVYRFLLTSADSVTTIDTKFQFPRPGHIPPDPVISYSVAANQIMAMTATFKCGDTSYHPHAGVPGDTIRYSSGTAVTGYKYNDFLMEVAFATASPTPTSVADVTWPLADNSNHSCGYFEFGSGRYGSPSGKYLPQWSIVSGGISPSTYTPDIAQYPRFAYHTKCNTCSFVYCPGIVNEKANAISNVVIAPNPANNLLDISFTAQNAGATVTLTNSFGQQVASQVVSSGHASFNTADLAEGVYIYTIDAKDGKSSGRVTISH